MNPKIQINSTKNTEVKESLCHGVFPRAANTSQDFLPLTNTLNFLPLPIKLFPAAGTQGNRASGRFIRVSDASLGCAADTYLAAQPHPAC